MHKTINGMKINDIMKEIALNSRDNIFKQYRYDCDNCSLSILTASHAHSSEYNVIEIAIKTKDFLQFLQVNPYEDEYETKEDAEKYWDYTCAILHSFPIIGLPVLLQQFTHCSEEYLNELWKGFSLIEGTY